MKFHVKMRRVLTIVLALGLGGAVADACLYFTPSYGNSGVSFSLNFGSGAPAYCVGVPPYAPPMAPPPPPGRPAFWYTNGPGPGYAPCIAPGQGPVAPPPPPLYGPYNWM